MTLIFLGLLLWTATHWMKRLAPGLRARLTNRYGEQGSRGFISGAILISIAMMTVGYKNADLTFVYELPGWVRGVNNLLMLLVMMLMGMGRSRGRLRAALRHPMLTGVVVFAIAHLLVNGDVPSLVLFGGLGLWALITIRIINAQDGTWTRPEPGPISGDVKLFVIALVIYAIIAGLHMLLGPNPFVA